jgi:hypothetical protein
MRLPQYQWWSLFLYECSRWLGALAKVRWNIAFVLLVVVVLSLVWYAGIAPIQRSWSEAARSEESIRMLGAQRAQVLRELVAIELPPESGSPDALNVRAGADQHAEEQGLINTMYSAAADAGFEVRELTFDSNCLLHEGRMTEGYRLVGYGRYQSVTSFARAIAESVSGLAVVSLRMTPRTDLDECLDLDVVACVEVVSEL